METAGKEIEDDALRQAMKDCGIGTPATRASIIETLFKRGYMERCKKSLVPTEKGLALNSVIVSFSSTFMIPKRGASSQGTSMTEMVQSAPAFLW